MSRLQQTFTSIRRLQQAPRRLHSTIASASIKHSSEDAPSASVEWENALPYSEIPGPRLLPFIGNVWRFFPGIGEYSNMGMDKLYESLYKKYGPICKLGGMHGPDMVIVSEPDLIEKIYRNEGVWPVRRGLCVLEHYYRDIREAKLVSLATSQGKVWQEFRTSVNQVMMQPRNTIQYVAPSDSVAIEFTERIQSIRDDQGMMPANFTDELAKWALESITYIALDKKLGILRGVNESSEAAVMIRTLQGIFQDLYELDVKPSPWRFVSTPTYRRFIKRMDTFTSISSKYVNDAMERLRTMSESDKENRQYSLLESLLIKTKNPNVAISMAVDTLLGGVDMTSITVATILYQLALNPEKQNKLQEELDRVIPDPSKTITKEQIDELKYLKACIKETMRCVPLFTASFRGAGKDMVLGGYQIPQGTTTSLSNVGSQQNEKFCTRAKEFLPERWLRSGGELQKKHPFVSTPFGFGPRNCVGKRFAELEMETLTARIFRSFTVEWNHPPVQTEHVLFLQFLTPLRFTIKDRV